MSKSWINNKRGFTLVEILVVVALTVIIMGLVFIPLVHSFNMTRQAEVMIKAQDNARLALSKVSQDLSDAMYVYDNTRDPINFPVQNQSGANVNIPVYYAKVDMILPRMRAYCTSLVHPALESRESTRHYVDGSGYEDIRFDEAAPRCRGGDGSILEIRPVQPLTPDTKIVRYFIGLRDPSQPYKNSYLYKLTESGQDNLFILYRAEFSPFDDRLFDQDNTVNENLADPDFFYNPTYRDAWRNISRPVVTLEDTDLVTFARDDHGNVIYDSSNNPVLTPTVRFAPTPIYNDPLVPVTDPSTDPEHGDLPTTFKASYGHWVLPYKITLERTNPDGTIAVTYETGPSGTSMCIFRVGVADPVFDIGYYEDTKAGASYGGAKYGIGEYSPLLSEMAFIPDITRGTVDFSLPCAKWPYCDTNLLTGPVMAAIGGKKALSQICDVSNVNSDPERCVLINTVAPSVLGNATIIPGSVKVIAPSAIPGSNGRLVDYTRVPDFEVNPGLNQYKVDAGYNPVTGEGAVYFHRPQGVDPKDSQPMPDGYVLLYYEVQNNKKGDILRANYVTKSIMTVTMGIRIYNSSSGKPELVQLTNKVKLRNVRN